MIPDLDRPDHLENLRVDDRDAPCPPIADIGQLTRRRDNTIIRIVPDLDLAQDLVLFEIDHRHLASQILRNIEPLPIRRDPNPGGKAKLAAPRPTGLFARAIVEGVVGLAAKDDLARCRRLPSRKIEDQQLIVISPRDEEASSIRREGNPKPGLAHRNRLRDLARLPVDDLDALIPIAIGCHQNIASVWAQDQIERQIVDRQLPPFRSQCPTIGKERAQRLLAWDASRRRRLGSSRPERQGDEKSQNHARDETFEITHHHDKPPKGGRKDDCLSEEDRTAVDQRVGGGEAPPPNPAKFGRAPSS